MLKQKFQEVEVGGKKYRLTKMDARTGSYIAAKLAMLAAPFLNKLKKDEGIDAEGMAALVASLSRKDFEEIQTLLLKRVQLLREKDGIPLPEPILMADGSFVDEELEYSTAAVMNLTGQSIIFNVGDFFAEAGLLKPAL